MKPIYMAVLLLAGSLHGLERLPYNHPGLVVDPETAEHMDLSKE